MSFRSKNAVIYLGRIHKGQQKQQRCIVCISNSFVFAQNTHMQINILGDCLPPSMCSFQY